MPRLAIHSGALALTPDQSAAALAAAQNVFDRAGVTPLQACEGAGALEAWDDRGFPVDDAPSVEEERAAEAWAAAERAVADALGVQVDGDWYLFIDWEA